MYDLLDKQPNPEDLIFDDASYLYKWKDLMETASIPAS